MPESWCIMSTHDASGVSMMHPICHHMAHHASWEDFDQTDLDHVLARFFVHFLRCPWFFLFVLCIHLFSICILGGSGMTQGASRDHWGSPGTILEAICDKVTFQECQKIKKNQLLKVSRGQIRRRSNRCGIDAQAFSSNPFISKTIDLPPQRPLC